MFAGTQEESRPSPSKEDTMSTPTADQLSLASHVALRIEDTDLAAGGLCIAWVESRGGRCGAKREEDGGLLCPRHRAVAARRRASRRASRRAKEQSRSQARASRERARLPHMRQELADLEAWLGRHERVFAPAVSDRAATGGAVHPSIAAKVSAGWDRGMKLWPVFQAKAKRAEELRARIARAEG